MISSGSVTSLFKDLIGKYGPQYWWPAESPLEVIEGAILAQNTSWKNVEKAMKNLKGKEIRDIVYSDVIEELIRPAGFHSRKKKYLREAVGYFYLRIENLSLPHDTRGDLLSLNGVGTESADAIALYAFHQRTFPVDVYTLRLFNRYFGGDYTLRDYEDLRTIMSGLFNQEQLMELHSLIDEHCKQICRKVPSCDECFLNKKCARNI